MAAVGARLSSFLEYFGSFDTFHCISHRTPGSRIRSQVMSKLILGVNSSLNAVI
jgi:hypothetical protein